MLHICALILYSLLAILIALYASAVVVMVVDVVAGAAMDSAFRGNQRQPD